MTDLGAGVWGAPTGPEIVRVLHAADTDLFYFGTESGYVYGADVGGYGRNELATLYLTGKLSLSPQVVSEVDPYTKDVAVIRNVHGVPVLAEADPMDGIDSLLADPAFHGNPMG